ncbi:hypothetical protein ACTXT7_005578 [Hymenolepis weldensis]
MTRVRSIGHPSQTFSSIPFTSFNHGISSEYTCKGRKKKRVSDGLSSADLLTYEWGFSDIKERLQSVPLLQSLLPASTDLTLRVKGALSLKPNPQGYSP